MHLTGTLNHEFLHSQLQNSHQLAPSLNPQSHPSYPAGVAGNSLLLPRLRQLPSRQLEVQATRQKLLGDHSQLESRINELVEGSVEDVLMLARWAVVG